MANGESDIERFFQCLRCMRDKPGNESMEKWARLNVGVTASGDVQVWCVRHRLEVVTIHREMMDLWGAMAMKGQLSECDCCPGGRHARRREGN